MIIDSKGEGEKDSQNLDIEFMHCLIKGLGGVSILLFLQNFKKAFVHVLESHLTALFLVYVVPIFPSSHCCPSLRKYLTSNN
jgi:hypothetical protein